MRMSNKEGKGIGSLKESIARRKSLRGENN